MARSKQDKLKRRAMQREQYKKEQEEARLRWMHNNMKATPLEHSTLENLKESK